MDRKAIIAVALALIGLVAWNHWFSTRMNEYRAQQQKEEAAKATPAPAATPAAGTPATAAVTAPEGTPAAPATAAATPAAPETLDAVKTPEVEYTFTTNGGGIAHATLLNHTAEHNALVALNQFSAIPMGAISDPAGKNATETYQKVNSAAGEVTYERFDAGKQLQISKKFVLPKEGAAEPFLTELHVTLTNKGAQPLQLSYTVHAGSAAPLHQRDNAMYTGLGWREKGKDFTWKDANGFRAGGFMGFGTEEQPVFTHTGEEVAWLGVTNQYYSSVLTPLETKAVGVWAERVNIEKDLVGKDPKHVKRGGPAAGQPENMLPMLEGGLTLPTVTVPAGGSITQKFSLYTGPREYRRLYNLGAHQDALMDFGWFKAVSKLLLNSMNWLREKLGTYALAIIVLTLIIRGLMWPLQNRATQSMKKMALLNPRMTELREKYKDDPQRMNMEVMKLYKEFNINPVSGCLPMFIQIPIFFGFYRMLDKAVELRNAKFLWVHDLSQPDTVAVIAGFPINVLPLLMAGTMLWQMQLSPKSGDATQQKILMFMPLIFVVFCYNYASALALYWTVQNIFSIVQLYVTRNQTTPVLQKAS